MLSFGAGTARRRASGVNLGVTAGLRRRLLVMLLVPLVLLALLNAWFDYRSADDVAVYGVALTAAQVSSLYAYGWRPGLVESGLGVATTFTYRNNNGEESEHTIVRVAGGRAYTDTDKRFKISTLEQLNGDVVNIVG